MNGRASSSFLSPRASFPAHDIPWTCYGQTRKEAHRNIAEAEFEKASDRQVWFYVWRDRLTVWRLLRAHKKYSSHRAKSPSIHGGGWNYFLGGRRQSRWSGTSAAHIVIHWCSRMLDTASHSPYQLSFPTPWFWVHSPPKSNSPRSVLCDYL
jgi:hypothetical protein